MHTAKQLPTEYRIAATQVITEPAVLRRKLGRVYRLILDYGCWKKAAAQIGAQDGFGETASQTG